MIKVYHNAGHYRVPQEAQRGGVFIHVADVDTEDLETAFERTNHIDTAWYDNTGVRVVRRSRSTSEGDLLVHGDDWYLVAPMGYTLLAPVLREHITLLP